jgi:hypothetical protein
MFDKSWEPILRYGEALRRMVVGGRRGKRDTGGGLVSILDAVEHIRWKLGADPEVWRSTAAEVMSWS